MNALRVSAVTLLGILVVTAGCADKKSRILSSDIPLNMYDLEEIRSGVDSHKDFSKTHQFIQNEKLNQYLRDIGRRLASVSERPNIPWQFFLVDNDETCEAFAVPGGHIYISSGLFRFIESEAELAAVIAHEVGHTSAYRYHKREESKKIKFGRFVKLGAGAAGGAIGGPAGGVASSLLSSIEMSSPYIKQQFSKSAEAEADGRAMRYLKHLGYPPEAIVSYNKKLASTPIDALPRFIHFFNAHPPSDFRVGKAMESLKTVDKEDMNVPPYAVDRHHEMIQELIKLKGGSTEKKTLIEKILGPADSQTTETPQTSTKIVGTAV